jgi:hypothetical protein
MICRYLVFAETHEGHKMQGWYASNTDKATGETRGCMGWPAVAMRARDDALGFVLSKP